ncbi:MAG: hypothetical protein LBB61_09995 [Treponema sp.]|jgi:menaquinone-dependent protoporphyrinogen IX oxidase|nr:hypothetical protein [Treponema sp.]
MKHAVRYFSKSGNTEKAARAIAGAPAVEAISINAAGAAIIEKTAVLFLGAAVYAFGLDDAVKTFIEKLDAAKTGKGAAFGTTARVKPAVNEKTPDSRRRSSNLPVDRAILAPVLAS